LVLLFAYFFSGEIVSAFVVFFERSFHQSDVSGSFQRAMDRLKHRGPDGMHQIQKNGLLMGHWHFWTTPEEYGERQPLQAAQTPICLVFDGRIDNRSELFEQLNMVQGRDISDAALVVLAFQQWGADCFERFVGDFALVLYDENTNRLVCARDPLGERTLFYALVDGWAVVASEPWAVAGAMDETPTLNEYAAAHYFALKSPPNEQTLFQGISELMPAHSLVITTTDISAQRYWQPDIKKKIRYQTEAEYARHFLDLFQESVRCRMRSITPVSVIMSGGLDSTSVACVAASQIKEPLRVISYVFDLLSSCDERIYINAAARRWGMQSTQLIADSAWPYKEWEGSKPSFNHPDFALYPLLKDILYRQSVSDGCRVALTGGYGDHIFARDDDWFADLVFDGKFVRAAGELMSLFKQNGIRWVYTQGFVQRCIKRILNFLFGNIFWFNKEESYPWLTSYSNETAFSNAASMDLKARQVDSMIGLATSQYSSRETFTASEYPIDLRYPFRDRRLIEFMLAIPAYMIYSKGLNKHILRVAMNGILPEEVRCRADKTSLLPLFQKGLEKERAVLQRCFHDSVAVWRKFVRPDWLLSNWDVQFLPAKDGPAYIIPSLCLFFETWYASVFLKDKMEGVYGDS
jgi:asparagine synthase (glutamine-hydrolysing)